MLSSHWFTKLVVSDEIVTVSALLQSRAFSKGNEVG
jgi:hypothetical protein